MVSRYLITTADERTWKFDRPVIFLGEWCRIYDRRQVWQNMDAIVAAPYGLGLAKKDADHAEARALEEKLHSVLCDTLNRYHGTKHSARFWRVVLGHWLRCYMDVMLNRVKTLEQCLQAHQLSGTTTYTNDHYVVATQDTDSAILAFSDARWNNALTVRILNLLGVESCPVEVITACETQCFRWRVLTSTHTLKRKILKWGYLKACKLASYFARDSDAFIINSYLPKTEEIKLQLALRQCPQLWASPKLEISVEPDRALRKNLGNKIIRKSENNLENILSIMVFESLPVCYLEGFADLNKLVQQHAWPKRPKFIFTSNNFYTDEFFKLWVALKIESGCRYIVGQHGANYGTHRYFECNTIEELTADRFLTWGWKLNLPQHTPAFIFKAAGRKAKACNSKGGLLLIELCLNHRITTWDGTSEFGNYFEEQQSFISELASTPKQHLTIRLHAASRYMKWNEEARWHAFDQSLKIETGGGAIKDLIAQSRLVVHSYDSTGILETLSQNIPTLAFWQNGLDHLRDSAKPQYQSLVDAGIVHLTPESVARKVNEVWDDVDGWWAQKKVQDIRKEFCDLYARLSHAPVRELKKIVLE